MSVAPDMTTATSVIIETRGGGGIVWGEPRSFVLEAVRSISATSRHREVEFVIVHHSMTPGATLASLGELPDLDLTFVPVEDSVTPAAALNVGALHASGRVLVFCEEHTQARSDEMLGHLIAPLSEKAAMVGPKLVDPDGDVWHVADVVVRATRRDG